MGVRIGEQQRAWLSPELAWSHQGLHCSSICFEVSDNSVSRNNNPDLTVLLCWLVWVLDTLKCYEDQLRDGMAGNLLFILLITNYPTRVGAHIKLTHLFLYL